MILTLVSQVGDLVYQHTDIHDDRLQIEEDSSQPEFANQGGDEGRVDRRFEDCG